MTEDEARKWLDKDSCIHWTEPDGTPGGMAGVIIEVKEGRLLVDWGYDADLEYVTRIHDHPETCEEL